MVYSEDDEAAAPWQDLNKYFEPMKQSLKKLRAYSVEAMDGPKGKVRDFLFDEDRWVIRCLEADYGRLLGKKKVLIPKTFMQVPDTYNEKFPVNLEGKDIEACPGLDEKVPASRAYEAELNRHLGIDNYWMYDFSGMGSSMLYPPRPLKIPPKVVSEKNLETSLRSFDEVKGYRIKAIDGIMGHIDDIIVDDKDWQIIYIIADTSNWLPWSKKVMLPLDFLEDISYIEQQVRIELKKEIIKNAPEYDSSRPPEIQAERAVYEYLTMLMLDKMEEEN
ncbi:MAG: hypothetical protein R6V34_05490 [Bacteroidales bacterium]